MTFARPVDLSGAGARIAFALAVAATLGGLPSCAGSVDDAAPRAPLPPGMALPEDVEVTLFGSTTACRVDADCASGLCYYGACGGLLTVDTRWMQEVIADRVVALIEVEPALRERVVHHLARILRRPRTELSYRARCVVGLERLGAAAPLREALPELPEAVAEAAAMALARLGDPAGLAHTLALTEHDRVPIAIEAVRSLGGVKRDDALVGLLRLLNPDLDGDLVRAALDGLATLGDPRAVRPLVAFLAVAPEFLVVRTARTLTTLTGAPIGEDAVGWGRWVAASDLPEPPPYTVRPYRTEDDIGLPPP